MSGNILIVARNNLHLTKRAVASAIAQDQPCEILVVDNASTDGSAQWLRSKMGIASVHLQRQLSLSACWNLGLEALWCNSYSPILVLNNDVEIRKDTYSVLWNCDTSESRLVTGVSVRSVEEMEAQLPQFLLDPSPHPDFSCFLISQKVYEATGKFNEEYYPAFFEDNDYHVRMHRAGIQAVSIPIPFLHHGSQTVANASPAEATAIRRGADKCRELFRLTYGCVPGTLEYDKLFT